MSMHMLNVTQNESSHWLQLAVPLLLSGCAALLQPWWVFVHLTAVCLHLQQPPCSQHKYPWQILILGRGILWSLSSCILYGMMGRRNKRSFIFHILAGLKSYMTDVSSTYLWNLLQVDHYLETNFLGYFKCLSSLTPGEIDLAWTCTI